MHRFINEKADITFADIFTGGGGVTCGALAVEGVKVIWGLNHNKTSIELNHKRHPETRHFKADIETQNVDECAPVDSMWASVECPEHSGAKTIEKKNVASYMLGWELIRYIDHCNPHVLWIENVPGFLNWAPLDENFKPVKSRKGEEHTRWVETIKSMGYRYEYRLLNTADFGCPTRRIRYYAIYASEGIDIVWPKQTHNKNGTNGLKCWVACRDFIDLNNEGESIFGREFNMNLPKQHRKPMCPNTQKRLAGGIKRQAPNVHQLIMTYHGSGHNCHTIDQPISTISTVSAKVLVTLEKLQFIQDHCQSDNFIHIDQPINTIMTRQTKQLATVSCMQSAQFISRQNNSNGNPGLNNQSLEKPLGTITSEPKTQLVSVGIINEKMQFISAYFNSGGHPESQNQSIDNPLNAILTSTNKMSLATVTSDILDFDIKTRFLYAHSELGPIMGFPKDYFDGYSGKSATRMIGNAVHTKMAQLLIEKMKPEIEKFKTEQIYL